MVTATVLAALSPAAAGRVFNVGSETATTVLDVVDALTSTFGTRVDVEVSGRYRLGDIRHNVVDTTRLTSVLGFEPSVSFVRRFMEWVVEELIGGGEYQRSLDEMAARRLLK